jgi:hypothetical protein
MNQLSGPIPTEIGQLTALTQLALCKYDGCLRCFHALFFIYKLTYSVLSSPLIALNSPTTHHRHSSPYCPFFVILITTDGNQLSGSIPTEIGELTVLGSLTLCKYDGCLRRFHALFFIYKLTTGSAVFSIYFWNRFKRFKGANSD